MNHTELIKIREGKKLSKGEFAALLGITAMMQGRYEIGKIKIPDHIAEKALALGAEKAIKKTVGKKVEKKAAKGAVKTAAGVVAVEEVRKAAKAKKEPVLHIESLMGGTITTEEILSRLPAEIDEVYIKPEENKAYWVKGKKTGDVDLW